MMQKYVKGQQWRCVCRIMCAFSDITEPCMAYIAGSVI